jgi:hypothetical protein
MQVFLPIQPAHASEDSHESEPQLIIDLSHNVLTESLEPPEDTSIVTFTHDISIVDKLCGPVGVYVPTRLHVPSHFLINITSHSSNLILLRIATEWWTLRKAAMEAAVRSNAARGTM